MCIFGQLLSIPNILEFEASRSMVLRILKVLGLSIKKACLKKKKKIELGSALFLVYRFNEQ